MKFPGRSQLDDQYAGVVRGENLTEANEAHRLQKQAAANAYKLATARHWELEQISLEDVETIGTSGRRFKIGEREWRLSEEHFGEGIDPKESGVELFFVDRSGSVRYLRKPYGLTRSGTGLDAAASGGRVAGNLLIDDVDGGRTRRLG